jgi:transcription elongation factor GreA
VWASAEYGHDVSELALLTRILQRAITSDQLPPENAGIVELGDEVAVEFANGYTQRFLVVNPIEAPLDDLNISVESPLGQALVGRRVGDQVEVDAPDGRFRCRILTTTRHQTAAPSWPRPAAAGDGWKEGRSRCSACV